METFLIGLVALVIILVIFYKIGRLLVETDDVILAISFGTGVFIIILLLGAIAYGIGVMIDIFIHTFL